MTLGAVSFSLFTKEIELHRLGYKTIAGVDEAGRGACAGPLVVAACILPATANRTIPDINDSKQITQRQRLDLYFRIKQIALDYQLILISPAQIDKQGVHKANLWGIQKAIAALKQVDIALIDGFKITDWVHPMQKFLLTQSIIKGDSKVAVIAAASILAKVTRDEIMEQLDLQYPGYGFAKHKGYVTREHQLKLKELGPSEVHRLSYRNVQQVRDENCSC